MPGSLYADALFMPILVFFCGCRNNAKTGKCAVCSAATQGIFNVAQDIVRKMKKAKQ